MRFYDAGRHGRQLRSRRGQGGRGHPGQPAVPVPARRHAGHRAGPASRTGSPTSSWPRGCRSSLGRAGPTRRWSTSRPSGRLDGRACSRNRWRGCWPIPRAEALATRFAAQWLRLQDLDEVSPDPILYPYYDRTLAQALQKETELFVASLVRDDRSVLELLTADYSFVNERVARHYGIPGVTGPQFRRVTLPEPRRGLLGQGSILTLTSIADRTSPVQRGKWILEVLLGSPPPPPPPNVPALEETSGTSGGKVLSVRERMEEHRKNPACTSCHKVIDPLGLALEHFDATGRYRIKDNEVPVDAVGDLYDGTRMDGAAGLRGALLKHQDAFLLSFTEHLMTYALGRRVEASDMPAVRAGDPPGGAAQLRDLGLRPGHRGHAISSRRASFARMLRSRRWSRNGSG